MSSLSGSADTHTVLRLPAGRLPNRAGVAALGVAVSLVLGGGVVTALSLPHTSDSTAVLNSAHGVRLIDSSGVSTAARSGQVVPMGSSLAVATGGSATLVTGPRTLLMASGSRAQILAPDSTELEAGDVVAVDPAGRPWSLLANDITVSAVRGSVRIDRNYGVRVATYVGNARIDVTTGATLTLTDLSQAAASQSALPASSSPLALIGDALDRRADPALLTAEDAYAALANQINADPFVAAAFRLGSSSQPSERVLPVAIGESAMDKTPKTRAAAQSEAAQLRLAGGSWAVIAARLGADLPDVRMKLSLILDSVAAAKSSTAGASETASAATVLAALASPAPVVVTATGGPATVASIPTTSGTAAVRPSGAPQVASKPTPSSVGQRPTSISSATSAGSSARPQPSATTGTGSGASTGTASTPAPGATASASAAPTSSRSATPSASPTPTPTTNPGLVGGLLNTVGGLLAPTPKPSS